MLLYDPELEETLAGHRVQAQDQARYRDRRRDLPRRAGAAAVGRPRRRRHRHDQLHERYDRAAEGRAAHAPQPVGQLDDVRLAHVGVRSRHVPAHAADVPLQRLGHAVRAGGDGREADRAAQGRRRRHPAPHRRARRHAAVRRARGRCRRARRRVDLERRSARAAVCTHGRRRCPAAHTHDRARRDRARLGVHPDLRADRDLAVAHDQPHSGRVRRACRRPSGRRGSGAPGCRPSACA